MIRPPFWYPPILAYHRIAESLDSKTPTVTPETFDRQMFLLKKQANPISMTQLVDSLERNLPIPPQSVVVTFDDGTQDHFTHAFPILKKHQIPAMIFVITDHLGNPTDLDSDQIRQMHQMGIEFGSHTLGHAYLPKLPLEEIKLQLIESRRRLESLGISAHFLSYPGGGFDQRVMAAAQQAGYRAACTTNRGYRRFPIDRWALRRITIHETAQSPFDFFVRLSGYYGINRRLRAPA